MTRQFVCDNGWDHRIQVNPRKVEIECPACGKKTMLLPGDEHREVEKEHKRTCKPVMALEAQ